MNAAAGYIGNAIQELMVVKKEVAQPRILPSISNMKVVSKILTRDWGSEISFYVS